MVSGPTDRVDVLEDWSQSSLLFEQERAVLEYAEAMTDNHKHVTGGMVEGLRVWFSEDAIVELTGLIAFQRLSSKFNCILDMLPQVFLAGRKVRE